MPGTPQRKQTKPEGRFQQGQDYNTGYRNVFHEIDIPGRQSHEPHSIRAHARETSPNQWLIGPRSTKADSRARTTRRRRRSPTPVRSAR